MVVIGLLWLGAADLVRNGGARRGLVSSDLVWQTRWGGSWCGTVRNVSVSIGMADAECQGKVWFASEWFDKAVGVR